MSASPMNISPHWMKASRCQRNRRWLAPTMLFFFLLILLAGLLYFSESALAIGTVHILDDENGGMCRDMGWTWDPNTLTCTMTDDLDVSGIDAIYIEADGVTFDGDGHTILSDGSGKGVSIASHRGVSVTNLRATGFTIGISASSVRDSAFVGNHISSASMGILLTSDSNMNFISENEITGCGYGINLSNYSMWNTVSWNTISSNAYGINDILSDANTFFYNTISSNSSYGVCFELTTGNQFYGNVLTSNAVQAAVFDAPVNFFDGGSSLGGNYWSDWLPPAHPDVNGDGYVDDPYTVGGNVTGQDNFPLVSPTGWDRTAPVISDLAPTGVIHNGRPVFTASYIDPDPTSGVNLDSATIGPFAGYECTASGSKMGTITCAFENSGSFLPEGHYDYSMGIRDNEGNTGSAAGSIDIRPYEIADEAGGRDCSLIGAWDPGSRTCTLTTDLTVSYLDGIRIAGNGVTLDGNGNTITYATAGTTSGVVIGEIMGGQSGVTVRNLTISGFDSGIEIWFSSGCTFQNNIIVGSASGYGLDIWESDHLDVLGNSISGFNMGVSLQSISARFNQFTGNYIHTNYYGIHMWEAYDNTFAENTVQGNVVGVRSELNSYNYLYRNNFIDNGTQAYSEYGNQQFFDGGEDQGGNYWSNFDTPPEGCDNLNGDVYCDAGYSTGAGIDNYPFTAQYGWDETAPGISSVQPSGNVHNGNPSITASYSDPVPSIGIDPGSAAVVFTSYPNQAPDAYVCTVNGSPDGTISCIQQGSPIYPLYPGHYEFQVSIADNNGNTGTASGSFDIKVYTINDTAGGGDCTLFGTWDAGTKTCTMTTDLNVSDVDGLYITSDGVTLDGNGHSLTCTDTLGSVYWGSIITGNTGVTIKNLTVTGFYAGVFLPGASGNTISGNHLTGNLIGAMIPYVNAPGGGITRPSNNLIIGNDVSNNSYAGLYFIGASDSRIIDNTLSGNDDTCVITDGGAGRENTGLTFSGNTCSGSPDGFWVCYTNDSRFIGNSVQCDADVFWLNQSDGNRFERNVITTNGTGFASWGVSDNDNNEFFSNSFTRPSGQFVAFNLVDGVEAGNIFNREFGGGNYYSWHDEPGFEGCSDANGDGFCDTVYGQDQRPWTTYGAWAPDYYWTWYDNLYGANWVLMANPASSTADSWFDIEIAGDDMDPKTLGGLVAPGGSLTPAYDGLMGGPVEVNHRGTGQAITSQRILWAGNSLEEVLGTAADRLTDHYYWTWYDEQSTGYKNWVMVANPDPVHDVYAEVKVAGAVRWSGTVVAGGNVTPHFPGVMGGPVEVQAWADSTRAAPADVMASQRVLTNGDTAFNELPGIPAGELSDHYVWTWYDQATPGAANYVMVANPTASPITYEIKIGGVSRGDSFSVPASGTDYQVFPGVMDGPVEVISASPAIASQRVIWGPSFGELPGYPYSSLDSTYHWTWYDWKSTGSLNWVMVALDPAETQQVHVTVTYTDEDGVPRTGSADLNPAVADQRRWYWSDPGYRGGPVQVTAHLKDHPETPKSVIASQRVLWNGYFNEVTGTVIN